MEKYPRRPIDVRRQPRHCPVISIVSFGLPAIDDSWNQRSQNDGGWAFELAKLGETKVFGRYPRPVEFELNRAGSFGTFSVSH